MKRIALVAAVCVTAACAHTGNFARGNAPAAPSNRVADADFAHLQSGQLSAIEGARKEVQTAHDATLRAEQQLTIAEKKIEVGHSTLAVARAQAELAKSQTDLAKATGDRDKIAAATAAQDRADAKVQLETAQADVVGAERDRVAAQAALAHKQEKVAEAKLELAKLDALTAAGDASVDHYQHRDFEQALYMAQTDVRRAEEDLKDEALLRQAKTRLEQAQAAFERAGSDVQPVRGTDAKDPKSRD